MSSLPHSNHDRNSPSAPVTTLRVSSKPNLQLAPYAQPAAIPELEELSYHRLVDAEIWLRDSQAELLAAVRRGATGLDLDPAIRNRDAAARALYRARTFGGGQ